MLPIVIIASREAIRAVPDSIRQGALALGATQWQTIWRQVLPAAIPGIATGSILALSRAIGEAAPLVLLGGLTFITFNPEGLDSPFTVLPIQIFNWISRPQDEFHVLAAAAIVVLLVLLLAMNAVAILLRNKLPAKVVIPQMSDPVVQQPGERPHDAIAEAGTTAPAGVPAYHSPMASTDAAAARARQDTEPAGEPVFKLRGVTVAYGGVPAVRDVDLDVAAATASPR